MTKNEMRDHLLLKTGVGVEVTTITNEVYYFFFEDYENDYGIERAKKHFRRGEQLNFYSNRWAQQSKFKAYIKQYKTLCAIERRAPEKMTQNCRAMYRKFIIKRLMDWTGCSYRSANLQISLGLINYYRFTGRVSA